MDHYVALPWEDFRKYRVAGLLNGEFLSQPLGEFALFELLIKGLRPFTLDIE